MPDSPPVLYLHIGRNKAGSTSLQDHFAARTQALAAAGVRYAVFGHLADGLAGIEGFATHLELARAFERNGTSMLVSSELISTFSDDLTASMIEGLRHLNVRVILYVRPYGAWVRSFYGFDVRTGRNKRDFDAYLQHLMPRVSFWPMLRRWGEALGWDRVRVRSTDPADLLGSDLVQDCRQAIGLAPAQDAPATSNRMPHWMAVELLRLVAGQAAAPGWDRTGHAVAAVLHALTDQAALALGLENDQAQYLTPGQAALLADLYNRDLERVRAHTGVRLRQEDPGAGTARAFLPSAAHIPARLLQEVAALALAPACATAHPEAAAFVQSPAFASLCAAPRQGDRLAAPRRASYSDTRAGMGRQMQDATRLAEAGDLRGAIDLGTAHARAAADADLLAALVRWRRDAFATLDHKKPDLAWPPRLADPFPGHVGIPAIEVADLTPDILGGAILHHGSLRVNGLVSQAEAEKLRLGIEQALAARDLCQSGTPDASGWYSKLDVPSLFNEREWVENGGAVWTADSPPMLFEVIEAFTRCGVIDHIETLMGERPALSVGKSTLRRVPVTSKTDWHQDGAFLGRDVRAVNVWLALSPCGVDAPGLDVVGTRLPYVMQTGSHGAYFDWSVGDGVVDMLAEGGAPVESPEFAPGDALLFDHMMLHRTGVRPGMTRPRWAIESWFFSPTHYPMEQVPLVV